MCVCVMPCGAAGGLLSRQARFVNVPVLGGSTYAFGWNMVGTCSLDLLKSGLSPRHMNECLLHKKSASLGAIACAVSTVHRVVWCGVCVCADGDQRGSYVALLRSVFFPHSLEREARLSLSPERGADSRHRMSVEPESDGTPNALTRSLWAGCERRGHLRPRQRRSWSWPR